MSFPEERSISSRPHRCSGFGGGDRRASIASILEGKIDVVAKIADRIELRDS